MSTRCPGVPPGSSSGSRGSQGTWARRRSADLDLLAQLKIRGWQRLLFIECGDGWVAEEAWRRMGKGYVCGLDRSSRRVALATRFRGVPGKLEFKNWDGCSVPSADGVFDLVVSQRDVRRLGDPVLALREMGRVVHPGGAVYLVATRGEDAAGHPFATAWPWLLKQVGLLLQANDGFAGPACMPAPRESVVRLSRP